MAGIRLHGSRTIAGGELAGLCTADLSNHLAGIESHHSLAFSPGSTGSRVRPVLFRLRRVFVSYSRKDADLRTAICRLLEAAGIEAVYDDRLQAGDELDPTLRRLIDRADALIALGTAGFMTSAWCCREVSYAIEKRKHYCPLIFPDREGTYPDKPDWFVGRLPRSSRTISYGEVSGRDDDSWVPGLLKSLEKHRSYRPWTLALLAALVCIAVPVAFAIGIRWLTLRPYGEILHLQELVEVRAGRLAEANVLERREGSDGVTYFDTGGTTPRVIAREIYRYGWLVEREYVDGGRVLATDYFSRFRDSQGDWALRKLRHIELTGEGSAFVEDHFDAGGRLMCKVVTSGEDLPTRVFGYPKLSPYPASILTMVYR